MAKRYGATTTRPGTSVVVLGNDFTPPLDQKLECRSARPSDLQPISRVAVPR
ncbi:hypothetical protein PanWU01x14_209400, partial [Parasponia andersonii]